MTQTTIQKAATGQMNASHDYQALHEEAVRLARRILDHLDDPNEPAGIHWGHVGDMAHIRNELRAISDQLFLEGEYAE